MTNQGLADVFQVERIVEDRPLTIFMAATIRIHDKLWNPDPETSELYRVEQVGRRWLV